LSVICKFPANQAERTLTIPPNRITEDTYIGYIFFLHPSLSYELSQDLLEKQIELLERKYGGVRARNAAVTIQRAFRHYMMVKKFASITAMAKAEKRLSRRMVVTASSLGLAEEGASSSSAYGSANESQLTEQQQQQLAAQQQQQQQQQQPRVTIMAGPAGAASPGLSRTPPTRSLSMRERRQLDCSPIPRSQSGEL